MLEILGHSFMTATRNEALWMRDGRSEDLERRLIEQERAEERRLGRRRLARRRARGTRRGRRWRLIAPRDL
ncbi:hypothetical protein [Acidimangrovimonas pyrenivorans]|uniref:Uncharacterized protein n=1 Tax=Acidimangrovimonas pyrenivorans TaxID=2030798 RepID=A0ABV7AGE9_9RHOB